MAHKLNQPEFQPVYELDQSLDTLLGYDYLRADIEVISQQFPQDDQHNAIRHIADQSLASRREIEAARALELQTAVKGNLSSKRSIEQASQVDAVKERYHARGQEILELEKTPEALFETALSEAGTDEREVVARIIKRKIETMKASQQAIAVELKGVRDAIGHVESILERPLPSKASPVDVLGMPPPEPFIADPTVRAFNQISNLLLGIRDGMLHEPDLVKFLYPGLYNLDRPRAYRQLDELYASFGTINTREHGRPGGRFLQRGTRYQANKAGRAMGSEGMVVYRAIWGDQEAIIKGKAAVEQRLTILGSPYVVRWDCVVPNRKVLK